MAYINPGSWISKRNINLSEGKRQDNRPFSEDFGTQTVPYRYANGTQTVHKRYPIGTQTVPKRYFAVPKRYISWFHILPPLLTCLRRFPQSLCVDVTQPPLWRYSSRWPVWYFPYS